MSDGWWFPWQVRPDLLADGASVHRKSLMKRPTSLGRRAKRMKDRHRQAYGRWCPGVPEIDHEPHRLSQRQYLTVDHIIPVVRGGTHQEDNLRVICNKANKILGVG
jgi:5-methylcytosine-specific restriction endonuclease McrA